MDMTPQEYQEYVKRLAPKSPIFKDTAFAFFIGGAICALGQLIQNGFLSLGLAKADAGTATSICLIFLSALLTGLNLYNSIARFAGAGTLVPITGFANSVVSPAIDFKSEGFITGMASKMFVVAGPVIVFGTLTSVVYGVILMLMGEEKARRGRAFLLRRAARYSIMLPSNQTIMYNKGPVDKGSKYVRSMVE